MLLRSFLLIIVFVCSQIVRSNDFVWYNGKQAISYAMPQSTAPVVKIAIDMFTEDMKQVTGLSPKQSPASQATIRIIQLDKADKKQQKELRGLMKLPLKRTVFIWQWPEALRESSFLL